MFLDIGGGDTAKVVDAREAKRLENLVDDIPAEEYAHMLNGAAIWNDYKFHVFVETMERVSPHSRGKKPYCTSSLQFFKDIGKQAAHWVGHARVRPNVSVTEDEEFAINFDGVIPPNDGATVVANAEQKDDSDSDDSMNSTPVEAQRLGQPWHLVSEVIEPDYFNNCNKAFTPAFLKRCMRTPNTPLEIGKEAKHIIVKLALKWTWRYAIFKITRVIGKDKKLKFIGFKKVICQ